MIPSPSLLLMLQLRGLSQAWGPEQVGGGVEVGGNGRSLGQLDCSPAWVVSSYLCNSDSAAGN